MSPAPKLTKLSVTVDRRRHLRFPITANAEYLLQGRRGEVITSNVSSGGVLVQSTDILPIGERVELRMDWPARLDDGCRLGLVVVGEVLRTTACGTVISVLRYEYRLDPQKAELNLASVGRDQEYGQRRGFVQSIKRAGSISP